MSWKPGLCHKIRPCSSIVLIKFCDCPQQIWIRISAKKSCNTKLFSPSQPILLISAGPCLVETMPTICSCALKKSWRKKKTNLINLSWNCILLGYQAWTPMLCSWHELCNPELFWKDGPKVWEVVSSKTEVKCQTRANLRRCKKVYKFLVTIFSLLLLPVFESEIHVNPKNPRSLLHIHAPFFWGSPAIQSTNHSSILPKHLLWICSFLPCWVSMGHRLGNFREPGTPNQPRNSLNNWVGDQEIHGRWSKPGNLLFQQNIGSYRKISWANHWTHIFRYIF